MLYFRVIQEYAVTEVLRIPMSLRAWPLSPPALRLLEVHGLKFLGTKEFTYLLRSFYLLLSFLLTSTTNYKVPLHVHRLRQIRHHLEGF